MLIRWRRLLSLGIIDASESATAKRVGKYFDYLLLTVMFWLPFQWHLESVHQVDSEFILVANWVVWGIFTLEAIIMTSLVQRKLFYLTSNWLNLFIIVAVFPPLWPAGSTYLAVLRYLRFIILLRIILPQLYHLHRILSRNRFGATLVVFLAVTLLSGVILSYIDPGIGSPWEGIWWAWQTVTTVGYGDAVPNTPVGKVFAALLMLIGVGLFSLVSANLAAYFIERGRRQQAKKPEKAMAKEFREIDARLCKIEQCHQRLEVLLSKLVEGGSSEEGGQKE